MDQSAFDRLAKSLALATQHRPTTRRGLLAAGLGLVPVGIPRPGADAKKKRRNKRQRKTVRTRPDDVQGILPPPSPIGPDWTHVVGGGGSILFYDKFTGTGLSGTLDGRGFTPVERITGFATGHHLVVGTPRGSVLFLRPQDGLGAAGTLLNGRWTFLNEYHGFAPWTLGAASADTVFLYFDSDSGSGHGASGTLVDGEWTFLNEYRNFYPDQTQFVATDDSLLFYRSSSYASAKAGTLRNGVWTFANSYPDIGNLPRVVDYHVQVGAGDTVLLINFSSGNWVIGRLTNGVLSLEHNYPNPAAYWSHAAHAGNGFVLVYEDFHGLAAWGTLGGGDWAYYGTT